MKFEIETEEVIRYKYTVEADNRDQAEHYLSEFIAHPEECSEEVEVNDDGYQLLSWEIKTIKED